MPVAIGLCGLGSAAERAHLPALSRAEETGACTIAGVCDPDPSRRDLFCERAREAQGFTDVVEMLDRVEPELLVVASPPSAHLPAITAALDRGVDVLCEKPLGINPGDLDLLHGLVARHPERLIAPVHQYRFAPAWRLFTRTLTVATQRDCPFRLEVHVDRPGTDPLSAGGWRADPEHEGGILGDHAVHYLALTWLTHPSATVSACRRAGEGGSETARVELRLGSCGRGTVTVSYAAVARRNRIVLDMPSAGFHLEWLDDSLTLTRRGGPGSVRRTGALSHRQFVNELYGPLYDELFAHLDDPAWRAARTAETLDVAALLAQALACATTEP